MKTVFFISAAICCCFLCYSQEGEVYTDFRKAKKNRTKVEHIHIYYILNDGEEFVRNLQSFKNLRTLVISDYNRESFPAGISELPKLESLELKGCSPLDFNVLLGQAGKTASLKRLVLDNNFLESIPPNIKLLESLEELIVCNNERFDIKKSIPRLATLKNLKKLGLPVNYIRELPGNISKLKNIEVLDLTYNNLTDLPDDMSELSSLDTLQIEGNIIINPVSTLERLQNLTIKYISLDEGLTGSERERLQELFPGAVIEEKKYNEGFSYDDAMAEDESGFDEDEAGTGYDTLNQDEINAESVAEDLNGNDAESEPAAPVHYGKINIAQDDFRLFSDAYLHYPDVHDAELMESNFDTKLFDQRYRDLGYEGTRPRIRGLRCTNICLIEHKPVRKGEISFVFQKQRPPNGYNNAFFNPELNAFRGMVWVYTGPLKKRRFTKTYMKQSRFERRFWTDIRLYYQDESKTFKIELKDSSRFRSFMAYPVLLSKNAKLEDAQKTYVSRYTRYLRTLNSRKRRLHHKIMSDKNKYDRAINREKEQAWTDLRRMYMSEEERELSMEEWYAYYDHVVADEKQALYHTTATVRLVIRALELSSFSEASRINTILDTGMTVVPVFLHDKEDNNLPVSKLLVINIRDMKYTEYKGSLGLKETSLFIDDMENTVIVAEMRSGDIGLVNREKIASAREVEKGKIFTVDYIQKSISSVGQVMRMLNL